MVLFYTYSQKFTSCIRYRKSSFSGYVVGVGTWQIWCFSKMYKVTNLEYYVNGKLLMVELDLCNW